MDTVKAVRRAIRLAEQLADVLMEIEGAAESPADEAAGEKEIDPDPPPIVFWCKLEAAAGRSKQRLVFDDKTSAALAPRLAELAAILLSDDGGDSSNGLVPFKSFQAIAGRMNTDPHNVSTMLGRLRKVLKHAGVGKQRLIESVRGKGARLRMKRQP